jgi:hypothetical protein
MQDIFYKNRTEYTNQLNPIKNYLEQLTSYIVIKKQLTKEQAHPIALQLLKKHFKDKPIKYFEREENGDRNVKEGTLLNYIRQNINDKNILVPTFTSYVNSKVKKSILSEFIAVNVKKRSIAKKLSHKAKAEGNSELAIAKDNEQSNMKIYNNSLSGVFGQEACVLYNPTAHNTLTSITRTMTSLSNASNEKLIAGNRYLPRGIDVLNSIVYITTYLDLSQLKTAIDTYGLYLPTVQDTVDVLKYSTDLYFSDINYYNKHIIPFLEKLTPYQLAGICYMGDLYHLRKFNSQFMFTLMTDLIAKVEDEEKLEDLNLLFKIDEAILNYVHTILYSRVKGYGKDYEKMNEANIASSVYKTALNVMATLTQYKLFFNTFMMNDIIPTNSHRLNNMRRRVVVLSDTDSTCFTLDEWITWYKGTYQVDDSAIALSGCLCYMAAQSIVNSLASMSKSMNIEDELLNTLALKSEFLWLSFSPATVSKHYYASTAVQEGNVFKEYDTELKGVHLKNSAVPKNVINDSKDIIKYILDRVSFGNSINLNYVIERITDLEKDVTESVQRGEAVYLKKSKIKSKEAYAQDEFKSPYQRHQLWVDVFEPKYGNIDPPPYDVVKIPTKITSRPLMTEWLGRIQDEDLKGRLFTWLEKYNKKDLPTFYISETYVRGNGIPEEIAMIVDIERIIFDMTMQHRLVLETLGVMINQEKTISEQFNI